MRPSCHSMIELKSVEHAVRKPLKSTIWLCTRFENISHTEFGCRIAVFNWCVLKWTLRVPTATLFSCCLFMGWRAKVTPLSNTSLTSCDFEESERSDWSNAGSNADSNAERLHKTQIKAINKSLNNLGDAFSALNNKAFQISFSQLKMNTCTAILT